MGYLSGKCISKVRRKVTIPDEEGLRDKAESITADRGINPEDLSPGTVLS